MVNDQNDSAENIHQTIDKTPDLDASTSKLTNFLAQLVIDQFNAPWRVLWLNYELAFLRSVAKWNFLLRRRQEKLHNQIAKRDPARFMTVVDHAQKLDIANSASKSIQRSDDFLPYNPQVEAPATDLRAIAFYLPQFHPFAENDEWWGKGFTEWTNVGKALPSFTGHYQPHCPIHFGYYDLRLPEIMVEQARVARHYGVHGFAYHFYWFAGRTLMEQPLRTMLQNKNMDFPFCLSWANENWTRRWDGKDTDVLIAQDYSLEDGRKMINHIADYLKDARYIRVNGRAVFSVYRPREIPDVEEMVKIWREEARSLGIGELHLIGIQQRSTDDFRNIGFDANLEFAPHGLDPVNLAPAYGFTRQFAGRLFDYDEVVTAALAQDDSGLNRYRSVTLGWDNTARSPDRATIYTNFSIDGYHRWLSELCKRLRQDKARLPDDRLLFINAWNEWAEGTHLEPDQRYGFAYLEATRRAISGN